MITFDYIGGRGVPKISKNDYVILEQPLMFIDEMKAIVVVGFEINQQIVERHFLVPQGFQTHSACACSAVTAQRGRYTSQFQKTVCMTKSASCVCEPP